MIPASNKRAVAHNSFRVAGQVDQRNAKSLTTKNNTRTHKPRCL